MLVMDDAMWLVLHEVRIRGVVAEPDAVVVASLTEMGVVATTARGVRITPEGRRVHAEWARAGGDTEAVVRRAYERFLPLNKELLQVCSDWQVRPGGVANDHRDARYDWSVIDRVRALDERAGPVISRLARSEGRFREYRVRLRAALARVEDGEHEWITSPRCDSYHTVWMQLHEDLLLALGLGREDEA